MQPQRLLEMEDGRNRRGHPDLASATWPKPTRTCFIVAVARSGVLCLFVCLLGWFCFVVLGTGSPITLRIASKSPVAKAGLEHPTLLLPFPKNHSVHPHAQLGVLSHA